MEDRGGQVRDFAQEWAAVERSGDTAFLQGAPADDFVGIGPLGFVLTKDPWLGRYAGGRDLGAPCRGAHRPSRRTGIGRRRAAPLGLRGGGPRGWARASAPRRAPSPGRAGHGGATSAPGGGPAGSRGGGRG